MALRYCSLSRQNSVLSQPCLAISTLFLQAPGKDQVGLREEQTIIRAGHNSRIGRRINRRSVIGKKLGKADYITVMTGIVRNDKIRT